MTRVDPAFFRSLVGSFPTGVTIVSTYDAAGEPVGATVSAFSSISMEPPLVMVALQNKGRTTEALGTCSAFAINVLREDQRDLALKFADRRATDRWDGIERRACDVAREEVPVLCDTLATILCRVHGTAVIGDHTVFIGQVIGGRAREGAPLVHGQGHFACMRELA